MNDVFRGKAEDPDQLRRLAAREWSAPSLEIMVRTWCAVQLGPWRDGSVDRETAAEEYRRINDEKEDFFLFRIDGGDVRWEPKPRFPETARWLEVRIDFYLSLIRLALGVEALPNGLLIPIAVGDIPFSSDVAPVFSFQKLRPMICPLVNDPDFVYLNYYVDDMYTDRIPYAEKKTSAVFVGSTTGAGHTVESIQALSSERISAAVTFRDDPRVDFRLPSVVQCVTQEAEDLLKQMGFGDAAYISWQDQYRHKFLLSLDGNGATCSRVALSLKSNGVLLKYNSDSMLYYFYTMIPWVHYIPIWEHADVFKVIEREERHPGLFEFIADNGRDFYNRYLTKEGAAQYAWTLFSEFDRCFTGAAVPATTTK